MRRLFSALIFAAVILVSFVVADAGVTCSFQPTCADTSLIYAKNDTGGGYNNAHAQLTSVGTYPNILCCSSSSFTLGTSCTQAEVLRLYATTDSHVQIPDYTGPHTLYTNPVCLSATESDARCTTSDFVCPLNYACIASIASSETWANDETNAHIAECDHYSKKICCRIGDVPPENATICSGFEVGGESTNPIYVTGGYAADCTGLEPGANKLRLVNSSCDPIQGALVWAFTNNNRWKANATTRADGIADFTHYTGGEADYFAVHHHTGQSYNTTSGTFDTGAVVQTRHHYIQLNKSSCDPLTDASVEIWRGKDKRFSYWKNVGEDGRVSFEVLPNTEMRFTVLYRGYNWSSVHNPPNIDTKLSAESYKVVVYNSSNNRLRGVLAHLLQPDGTFVYAGTTGTDGNVSIDVLPDAPLKYQLLYNGMVFDTDVNVNHTTEIVQTETFGVELRDSYNATIPNVLVTLKKANGAYATYKQTDTNGQAKFEVFPNNTMRWMVSYHGHDYLSDALDVGDNPLTLLNTFSYNLTFRDRDGFPIPNTVVHLRRWDNRYVAHDLTNSNGIASFEALSNATLKLDILYHGSRFLTNATNITENTNIVVRAHALGINLSDGDMDPISGALVQLRTEGDRYADYTRTGVDGLAYFDVLPGSCHILAVKWKGATQKTDVYCTNNDTTVPMIINTSLQAGNLKLFLNASTNVPIQGARIHLLSSAGRYADNELTDPSGLASFWALPNAIHKFAVLYRGAVYETDYFLINQTLTVNVTTIPYNLTVKDRNGDPVYNVLVHLLRWDDRFVYNANTNIRGEAIFEVLPGSQMRFEVLHRGGTNKSEVITINEPENQTIHLSYVDVNIKVGGVNQPNQPVTLVRGTDERFVYVKTTDANGDVSFNVPYGNTYKVKSTYDGTPWTSGVLNPPATTSHDFT